MDLDINFSNIFFFTSTWIKKLHIEPFNYTRKSVWIDFGSTYMGSSVIKTGKSEGSLLLYFYLFWCHYPLITYLNAKYLWNLILKLFKSIKEKSMIFRTKIEIEDLQPGVTYELVIKAGNANGTSQLTPPLKFITG